MTRIIFVFLIAYLTVVLCEVPKEFIHGHQEYTIDLMRAMGKGHKENLVFSPFSLESNLALTALGSKGIASAELKKLLQVPEADEKTKTLYTAVHKSIQEHDEVKIITANRVYLAENIEVEPSFKKTAEEVFHTGVENINFENVENATDRINSWVTEQMHEKTKKIIKKDHLSPDTRMALINTLHFQGSWQYPFPKEHTEKRDFHTSKNQTIQVDTMVVTGNFPTHRNEKYKVSLISLPFVGTNGRPLLNMAIPDEVDGLEELEETLKQIAAEQRHYNYSTEYMKVYIPKFRVDSSNDMKPFLQDMGVKGIFETSDFSGITKDPVKVDVVVQKVLFEINENGTEGVPAATSLTEEEKPGVEPKEFHIDRPFLFGVHYDQVVVMAGRIMNPSKL